MLFSSSITLFSILNLFHLQRILCFSFFGWRCWWMSGLNIYIEIFFYSLFFTSFLCFYTGFKGWRGYTDIQIVLAENDELMLKVRLYFEYNWGSGLSQVEKTLILKLASQCILQFSIVVIVSLLWSS